MFLGLSRDEWHVIGFTAWVSLLSIAIILAPGIGLAYALARKQWRGKTLVETFIALPLVMPPVATGLILLKLFGRKGPIGHALHDVLGLDIVFTWLGVLLALGVMSFPLLVRSARTAFENVPSRLEQIAETLGASKLRVFFTVSLPLASRGITAGLLLAFARALGEFGATMLVAGSIPGKTTTLSVSIFQAVQLGDDSTALRLLGVSITLAFAAMLASEWFARKQNAPNSRATSFQPR